MIEWKKLDAGEYVSNDERFHAWKGYDRVYGNHWILRDKNEPDYHKGLYHEETLWRCKAKAESIMKNKGMEKDLEK